jgi:hypothetical protein
MDVPCPKSNSTDLQKDSMAREEVLYRCDKRAQFHGVATATSKTLLAAAGQNHVAGRTFRTES